MLKAISAVAVLGLAGSIYLITTQAEEIEVTKAQAEQAKAGLQRTAAELERLTRENRKYRVVNAVLKDASDGWLGTRPETLAEVSRVVDYILTADRPPETKFLECWDRKDRTTRWGSMGPDSSWILDECLDSVVESKSAILLREGDTNALRARATCGAEAGNRVEAVRDCAADSNYRLLTAANQALFQALTQPGWIERQEPSITQAK